MIEILVAEDQTLTRAGYHALLKASPGLNVVGEAANGHDAIRVAKELNPHVILMNRAMPEISGVEACRQIHTAQPCIRIIILSQESTHRFLFESLQAGAAGFFPLMSSFTELLSAIQTVTNTGTYLNPSLTRMAVDKYYRQAQGQNDISELGPISGREREVLRFIAEGNSSAAIAKTMSISARTVDTHRQNMMKKLGVHSISGLTRIALRNGLCTLYPHSAPGSSG
jgi:DNA-binding NarL/FixJ family response regulator